MIDLYEGKITDLLSNSMRYNPETMSTGYAVLLEKQRIMRFTERTHLMVWVEHLDERILDYLALELRTPVYDDRYPIEVKQQLVKSTLLYYQTAGTPGSLIQAVENIFGKGVVTVSEWFEYGGLPGYFRVQAFNPIIPGEMMETALEELYDVCIKVKRLSAHLELVKIVTEKDPIVQTMYLGGMFFSSTSTRMIAMEPELQGLTKVYIGASAMSVVETATPSIEGNDVQEKKSSWKVRLQSIPKKEEAE